MKKAEKLSVFKLPKNTTFSNYITEDEESQDLSAKTSEKAVENAKNMKEFKENSSDQYKISLANIKTEADLQKILRQIEDLKAENKYLKKMIKSKRFRFAEKIANAYNTAFPLETRRRAAISNTSKQIKKFTNWREQKKEERLMQKLKKLVSMQEKVFVVNSILWDVKLKQRPHHLAESLRKLGFFIIYLEEDNYANKMRKIKKNLVTINDKKFLEGVMDGKKGWFLTANNLRISYEDLKWVKAQGFEIVYDYLDEFHEDIAGDLEMQLDVWRNLPKLKPALMLATAKKLYNDIVDHMGSNKKVLLAQNAVNVEHFDFTKNNVTEAPNDLRKVLAKKRPIVGFYGALDRF